MAISVTDCMVKTFALFNKLFDSLSKCLIKLTQGRNILVRSEHSVAGSSAPCVTSRYSFYVVQTFPCLERRHLFPLESLQKTQAKFSYTKL